MVDWAALEGIGGIATAIAVIVALVFGVIQVRHQSRHRDEVAAMDMLHTIQTPEYIHAWATLWALPDAAPARDIAADPAKLRDALIIATTIETIAFAIDRDIIPYELWRDGEGGVTHAAWSKLSRWVAGARRTMGDRGYARFEALAMRLAKDPLATRPTPAAGSDRPSREPGK